MSSSGQSLEENWIPGEEIMNAFRLEGAIAHNETTITGSGPITVITGPQQWSYAAAFRFEAAGVHRQGGGAPILLQIDSILEIGRVGFLFVADDLKTVLGTTAERAEVYGSPISTIKLAAVPDSGWLILRNHAFGGERSKCVIRSIRAFQANPSLEERYPVVVSTGILKKFHPWSGPVPAGFIAYFLGNLTRAAYWTSLPDAYDHEHFAVFSGPALNDSIFDWLILLEAVAEAKNEFVMAEVGAGWGRWLVAGAVAARQLGGIRCRLIGVEAEPTHFQWMLEHFRDNHLDPAEHDLIEAAASGQSGYAWFHFGKPDSWYGQSIIGDITRDLATAPREVSYNGERAKLVRTVDIAEILIHYPRIDYLHLDIQGAELNFLGKHPALLDRQVKRVLVGTHSTEIESGLRYLFHGLHWHCQYDVPLNGTARVDGSLVTMGDGVQVWINPKL